MGWVGVRAGFSRLQITAWFRPLALLTFVALILLALLLLYRPGVASLQSPNGRSYKLAVADTETTRERGLGGQAGLKENEGMLFVFEHPGKTCFWMKDMGFSVDIVWLDAAKRVIKVEPNVAPETYPDTFCPDRPAAYVVELAAGQAGRAGLRTGSLTTVKL